MWCAELPRRRTRQLKGVQSVDSWQQRFVPAAVDHWRVVAQMLAAVVSA